MSLAEVNNSRHRTSEAYLRAVFDRGILHRQHVHVIPASFATLGLSAVIGHEILYGFARDGGGQVGRDLT